MAYTLLGGRLPFNAEDAGALQHQIKFSKPSYADEVGGELNRLIARCSRASRVKLLSLPVLA